MVKKRVSIILKPLIRTSASINKKTFVKLDDYADEESISKVNLTDKIFWKEVKKKFGTTSLEKIFKDDKKYQDLVDGLWVLIKSKMNMNEESLSEIMEEGISEVVGDE